MLALVRSRARGLPASVRLPADSFDHAAVNPQQRGIEKCRRREAAAVTAAFHREGGASHPAVIDDGAPVPEHMPREYMTRFLFEAPVPAASGPGAGPLQSARNAAQCSHRFALGSMRAAMCA